MSLHVKCPMCAAEIGDPCITLGTGSARSPHAVREKLAAKTPAPPAPAPDNYNPWAHIDQLRAKWSAQQRDVATKLFDATQGIGRLIDAVSTDGVITIWRAKVDGVPGYLTAKSPDELVAIAKLKAKVVLERKTA